MPEPEEYPPGWMWIGGFVFALAFSVGVVGAAGYGLYRLVSSIF